MERASKRKFFKCYDDLFNDGLDLTDVVIYGVIDGYPGGYYGSLEKLSKRLNLSKRTLVRRLQSLVDRGYLTKEESPSKWRKPAKYRAVEKFDRCDKMSYLKDLQDVTKCHNKIGQNDTTRCDKMSHNKTNYKINLLDTLSNKHNTNDIYKSSPEEIHRMIVEKEGEE